MIVKFSCSDSIGECCQMLCPMVEGEVVEEWICVTAFGEIFGPNRPVPIVLFLCTSIRCVPGGILCSHDMMNEVIAVGSGEILKFGCSCVEKCDNSKRVRS